MGNVTTAAHDHNPAHAARGAQLVMDAVVRVLVRDGLDGLSVRRVAAEAGISIGAVQHHFATKDALLVAAAEHVTTQFKSRADELTRRALAEEGPTAAFLVFCQLLANAVQGSDEETEDTAASIIWLWYAAKATQRGVVADAFTTGWSQTEKGAVANFRRRAVTTQSSSSDARCGSAFSGSLEHAADDHRIRVRLPVGKHRALAFP